MNWNTILKIKSALIGLTISISSTQAQSLPNVSISGNDKTSEGYIKSIFRRCYTDKEHPSENYLTQCIKNTRVFSEVKVEKSSTGYSITIEEKLSMIPIPMFQRDSSGNTRYGLFLLDTNFFGYGKVLAINLMNSGNNTLSYGLIFRDRALFYTNWTLTAIARNIDQTQRLQINKSHEVAGFHETSGIYALKIGRLFSSSIHFSTGIERKILTYKNLNNFARPDDVTSTAVTQSYEFDQTDYKVFVNEGIKLKVEGAMQTSRTDNREVAITSKSRFDWAIVDSLENSTQIVLQHGSVSHGDVGDLLRVGNNKGFRGIDLNSIWVERYATASVEYQVPLYDLKLGAWSFGPFYDYGSARIRELENDGEIDYQAFGLGTYIYLKKVAFPGLGIEFGRNTRFQDQFASLAIGFNL